MTTRSYCPYFHHTVELLGRRWTGVILRVLADGPKRFRDIRASIPGLSDRLLSRRLCELETEGVIHRCERDGNACYGLSSRGREIVPALDAIASVAAGWARDTAPADKPGRIRDGA